MLAYLPLDSKDSLAGVTVLAVYNSGEWIKFFVSENATQEQTDAVVALLPAAELIFPGPTGTRQGLTLSAARQRNDWKHEV